jgi:hypothetical protein
MLDIVKCLVYVLRTQSDIFVKRNAKFKPERANNRGFFCRLFIVNESNRRRYMKITECIDELTIISFS